MKNHLALFGTAQWIWPLRPELLFNCFAQFRRDFELKAVPRQAPFLITADQVYALYVNGQYVARGPARGYQASWPYDELDLAPYLRRGHNWLSVVGYNAGFSTFQYIHERDMGMLCNGRIGGVDLASGPKWHCRVSPAHKILTGRLSLQINFQENFDSGQDDEAWLYGRRFNADGWAAAKWTRPLGGMPWHTLEPRGIPHLSKNVIPYERTCTMARGKCGRDWRTWTNLAWGFRDENKSLKWTPAAAGRRVRQGEGQGYAVTLPAAGADQLAAVALDLGQIGVGMLQVEAQSAQAGQVVDFYFSESLTKEGAPVVFGPGEMCEVAMAGRLILRQGRTRHEFFQYIGHRYLVAIARGTRVPVKLKVALRETIYPMEQRGRFATNDQNLNDIYRISVRTQRTCALDAYVDTAWREQAQWWGDARVQVQNTFHISGDTRLLVRGVRSIAAQEVPNGLTYGHAPTIGHTCIQPDFSMIWGLTIWDYYYQTGDLSLFVEQWPRIQRLLGYFTGEGRGQHGLLQYDPRYWLFLDWTEIQREGTPTLLNLWHVLLLEKLSAMALASGLKKEGAHLRALYAQQRKLVLGKLFDAKAQLFHDGLTAKGKPSAVHSIHTQTLALLCGLQPAAQAGMIAQRLLPYLRGQSIPGAQPSAYWVTYIYGVMQRRSYGPEVIAHIRRHWTPMIPFGGTAEGFDYNGFNCSTSHAWSAHPIYHFTGILAGVTQTQIGWKRIGFAPVMEVPGLDKVAAVVPTPHGEIEAGWQRASGRIEVVLNLPKGIQADVRLPGKKPCLATGRNRWRIEA